MTIPRATARLQLHKDFTFDDAAAVVGYYARLGISHLYISPMLVARSGSTHGYDVVDPTRINPELGGEEGLRRLVERLREHGMGLIADIVPNHMGIGPENPWWQHVLEWGQESPYARWFDISWESPDPALHGKVLAPFLGQPYGDALRAGDIQLRFDQDSGKIYAAYYAQRFPLAPVTYADVLRTAGSVRLEKIAAAFEQLDTQHRQEGAEAAFAALRDVGRTAEGAADIDSALTAFSASMPRGIEALHLLLERQHYRLAWWRNAAEEINWRRFFEVSDLAGVRVEQDDVFEATHALIFRLYSDGLIDGVRVDHVDGLADPAGYCRKLRRRLTELASRRPPGLADDAPYIIVEKILAADERLRSDWDIDGTTGYEFMDQASALLHDPEGAAPLAALWSEAAGGATDFAAEAQAARRQILAENLVAEFEAAARALHAIARADIRTRDFSLASIRRALTELLVHFPVYRTYAGADGRDPLDQQVFDHALQGAGRTIRPADRPLLDAIANWLGGGDHGLLTDLHLRALTRFQQLTPPLAAKSVEDTAFYRYGRLLSRNEVGADPGRFAIGVQDFHDVCVERAHRFPHTLLATATHDHKRGEDVRARLAVLSEVPRQWAEAARRWRAMNARLRAGMSAADELMLYQMLFGAWPLDLAESDRAGLRAFAERIDQWQTKALREAKRASSWTQPDERYEAACRDFLYRLLDPDEKSSFLQELAGLVRNLAPAGVVNSLTQVFLRLSSPGIPDLYQGTELWDFSLVDPDNRRPVDHGARARALDGASVIANADDWQSGRLKQQVIRNVLAFRAREPMLFAHGDYVALAVEGSRSMNVIAFMRRHHDSCSIAIATRLPAHIVAEAAPVVPGAAWESGGEDTVVVLPDGLQAAWTDVLTGARIESHSNRLRLAEALRLLPVALLEPIDRQHL